MTVVLCGSGSGGHITPLLAVANEIKRLNKNTEVVYIGEKSGKYNHIIESSECFDQKFFIYTGKFRRYHGESLVRRFTDIKTIFLNTRDIFRVIFGTLQGIYLLRKLNPQAILLKGGSVCVPAGIGARLAKVFTVTHDSDALPGVSNRVGGKHATYHTTAMSPENYNYPKHKTIHVGLPISGKFRYYDRYEKDEIKNKRRLPIGSKVLLITGGSGGAQRLNSWLAEVVPILLSSHDDLYVIFISGKGKMPSIHLSRDQLDRLELIEFSNEMAEIIAISDVVVSRAGATTINEFAAQKKAVILVPNPDLTGGHQIKNARSYADTEAAVVIYENQIQQSREALVEAINHLLSSSVLRRKYGEQLHKTLPEIPAATRLAEILLKGRGE